MAGYKKALAAFEAAVRAHENMGAQPPADWPLIERDLREARRVLITKLNYRQLAAEERIRQEKTCRVCFTPYEEPKT